MNNKTVDYTGNTQTKKLIKSILDERETKERGKRNVMVLKQNCIKNEKRTERTYNLLNYCRDCRKRYDCTEPECSYIRQNYKGTQLIGY